MSGRTEVEGDLKRLGFLKSYLTAAVSYAEGAYATARGLVPAFAEPYALQAEETARSVAAPLVTRGQDVAADLLALADAKLDDVLNAHSKNMGELRSARSAYYGFVEGAVDATKSRLDPQRYVEFAAELLKSAAQLAVTYADPDAAVAAATAAADRVLSFGPVPKVLELADPLITVGHSQYDRAHDALLAHPLYRRAYSIITSLPAAVRGNPLFGALYPLFAPVADPVVAKWSASKALRRLEEHLRPKAE